MEEEKSTIKYSSYTPAQKKATKKYRENNKEKVNLQRKKYYLERKERDPNFLLYKRKKAKEYYQKKKAMKKSTLEPLELPKEEPIIEPVIETVSTPEPIPEPIPTSPITPIKEEKKKRKYIKKAKV